MKFLNKKLNNSLRRYFFLILFLFTLNQCSLISHSPHIQIKDQIDMELYNSVSGISFNGNINIDAPENSGRLFTKFTYDTLDTLFIQFRDPIARKVALMKFKGNEFLLWLQRENKRFDMENIPSDYSIFLLDNLSLNEIRKIFIGKPIFFYDNHHNNANQDSIISYTEKGLKSISFFDKNHKGIERINLYNNDTLSTIIEYDDYINCNGIDFPSHVLINGIYANYMLDIKFYHYSVELDKFVLAKK